VNYPRTPYLKLNLPVVMVIIAVFSYNIAVAAPYEDDAFPTRPLSGTCQRQARDGGVELASQEVSDSRNDTGNRTQDVEAAANLQALEAEIEKAQQTIAAMQSRLDRSEAALKDVTISLLECRAARGAAEAPLRSITSAEQDGAEEAERVRARLQADIETLREATKTLTAAVAERDETIAALRRQLAEQRRCLSNPGTCSEPEIVRGQATDPTQVRLRLSRNETRLVQHLLNAAGAGAGVADGLSGRNTRSAIRRWQQANDFPATGYLIQTQFDRLKAVSPLPLDRLDEQTIRAVEAQLAQADYKIDRVDGRADPDLVAAIRAWQMALGYESTGRLDETQLNLLLRDGGDQPRIFRDCDVCPEMAVIPAGSFLMGAPKSEDGSEENERPQHTVTIGRAFAAARYELTFREWRVCERAGACKTLEVTGMTSEGRYPVRSVSWDAAEDYIEWLQARTGYPYRLPSESEWEYMARAGTRTPFNTGRMITSVQANFDARTPYAGSPRGKYRGRPLEVGSFAPNAFGLFDTHGNVAEFVMDCWEDNYLSKPRDGRPWTESFCLSVIIRGGSWFDEAQYLRSANRRWIPVVHSADTIGFRVVRDLP